MSINYRAFFEKRGFKVGHISIGQNGHGTVIHISDPNAARVLWRSLPEGSVVIFMPLSWFDRFKNFIWRR